MISIEAPKDGDLWWQMEYGRQLLENGTLITNHLGYSWTQSTNTIIYCAWIAQILLHLIYESWGIIGLNILRLAILVLPALLAWSLFRQRNIRMPIAILGVAFAAVYAAKHAAGLLKPELFGFLFFSILCFSYFAAKNDKNSRLAIVSIPVTLLLWINSHGTFAVGCFFLLVVLIGELLNRKFKPNIGFNERQWKLIYLIVPFSILAILANPYGVHYPLQLIPWYAGSGDELAYSEVLAYNSIFSDVFKHFGVIYFFAILGAIYLLLSWETIKQGRFDISILLVNIVFLYFSSGWARASYFSPIILLMSISFLAVHSPLCERIMSNNKLNGALAILSTLAMIMFAGSTFYSARLSDPSGPPLSVGYLNPQDAARYVENNHLGAKICNGYNGGGYLLWLFRNTKRVMIDPRYFPYKEWYADWVGLTRSPDSQKIAQHDCDLWIINHNYGPINNVLVQDNNWKLAFIGPAAAVYLRSKIAGDDLELSTSPKLSSVTTLQRTALIINTLLGTGDFNTAEQVASDTRDYWINTGNEIPSLRILEFVQGTKYYFEKEDILAYSFLRNAHIGETMIWNHKRLEFSGQYAVAALWRQGRFTSAHTIVLDLVDRSPDNLINLFNSGLLTLLVDEQQSYDWEAALNKFLANPSTGIPKEYYEHAKAMLKDSTAINVAPLIPRDKR